MERKALPAVAGPKPHLAVKKSSCKSKKRSPKKAQAQAPNLSTHDVTGYVSEDDEAISRFNRFAKRKSKEQREAESEYLTRKFARLATRHFNDHRRNEEFIPEYELIKPLIHELATSPTLGIEYHTNFVARPKGESAALDKMFFAAVKCTRCDFFEVQSCRILGPVESNNGLPGIEACFFCDDVLHPKGWGTTCV